ncbi:MAG: 3-oxoacyl-ACP reductase [Dehalococcoidia bacterium]|nr:3-oxoacyl-ACP reductase [Dehalococcoidia bacterium]
MNIDLKGKVAVVLAGSSGIGKGVAKVLSSAGAKVAICSRSEDRLNKASIEIEDYSGFKPLIYSSDISKKESLISFLNKVKSDYGSIDILINNAGGPPPGNLMDLDDLSFEKAHNLTLMSSIYATKYVASIMSDNNWGRIIFISSTGVKSIIEGLLLSNIYRSAVAGFAKSISAEFGNMGLRVHNILSGPFDTARVKQLGDKASKSKGISFDKWKEEAEANTPLGRFGDPLEMGNLVAFLSSDLSSYMTGTTIAIDGGALKTVT